MELFITIRRIFRAFEYDEYNDRKPRMSPLIATTGFDVEIVTVFRRVLRVSGGPKSAVSFLFLMTREKFQCVSTARLFMSNNK